VLEFSSAGGPLGGGGGKLVVCGIPGPWGG
jgi:hypothetical protein